MIGEVVPSAALLRAPEVSKKTELRSWWLQVVERDQSHRRKGTGTCVHKSRQSARIWAANVGEGGRVCLFAD